MIISQSHARASRDDIPLTGRRRGGVALVDADHATCEVLRKTEYTSRRRLLAAYRTIRTIIIWGVLGVIQLAVTTPTRLANRRRTSSPISSGTTRLISVARVGRQTRLNEAKGKETRNINGRRRSKSTRHGRTHGTRALSRRPNVPTRGTI